MFYSIAFLSLIINCGIVYSSRAAGATEPESIAGTVRKPRNVERLLVSDVLMFRYLALSQQICAERRALGCVNLPRRPEAIERMDPAP